LSNWYIDFLKAYGDTKVISPGITEDAITLLFPKDRKMHQEFLSAHGSTAAYGLIAYIIYYLKTRRPSKHALDRVTFFLEEELRLIRRGFYEVHIVDDLGNYRERLPIAVKRQDL
jgi:hypothetical protein